MSDGVAWDYEEGPNYYHVFAVNGMLDGCMESWAIEIPRSPEHDADVQSIVEALNRIARRLEPPR